MNSIQTHFSSRAQELPLHSAISCRATLQWGIPSSLWTFLSPTSRAVGTTPRIHPWEGFPVLRLLLIYRWHLTCHFSNIRALNEERVQKFKFVLPSPELARQQHWAWVSINIKILSQRIRVISQKVFPETAPKGLLLCQPVETRVPGWLISVPLAVSGERLQGRVLKGNKLSMELSRTHLQQMPWRWGCFTPEARIC